MEKANFFTPENIRHDAYLQNQVLVTRLQPDGKWCLFIYLFYLFIYLFILAVITVHLQC